MMANTKTGAETMTTLTWTIDGETYTEDYTGADAAARAAVLRMTTDARLMDRLTRCDVTDTMADDLIIRAAIERELRV